MVYTPHHLLLLFELLICLALISLNVTLHSLIISHVLRLHVIRVLDYWCQRISLWFLNIFFKLWSFILLVKKLKHITTLSLMHLLFQVFICLLISWSQIWAFTMEIQRIMPLLHSSENHVCIHFSITYILVPVSRVVLDFYFFRKQVFF